MEEAESKDHPCHCVFPTRILVAILAFLALTLQYGFRVNLNVIILSMINTTAVKMHQKEGYSILNRSREQVIFSEQIRVDGPFVWDDKIRGVVLSAYFWGYILLQLPAGRLSEILGSKWVFFSSIMANTVGCLLIPLTSYMHWGVLVALRILQGAGGGMLVPTASVLVSRWVPPSERSTISSLIFSGSAVGTVIFMLSSGYLAMYVGWEAAFYIEGIIGLIWCVVWAVFSADNPMKMKWLITQKERDYIVTSIAAKGGQAKPKMTVPWRLMAKSAPFWSIVALNTFFLFGWYCFLVELPNYMNRIMRLPVHLSSIAAALPYVAMCPFSIAVGRVLDYYQTKEVITCTTARKIAVGIGTIVPAVCTGIFSFVSSVPLAIFVVCVTNTFGSVCMFSGYLANPVDIAPNFAGTILGVSNSCGTIGGIIAPLVLGAFLDADDSIRSWRIVFFALCFFYILAFIIYLIFGSGEVQPWNNPEESE